MSAWVAKMMFCNISSFSPPFTFSAESWLYNVIEMGDIDFGYNNTQEDGEFGEEDPDILQDEKFKRWLTILCLLILIIPPLISAPW